MTRTDTVRVPVAALAVLVAAVGLTFWGTDGSYVEGERAPGRPTGVASGSTSPASEGQMTVLVRVVPRGDLVVVHQIHLAAPVASLAVTTPVDPNLAALVSASGLRLWADGVAVEGPTELRNETGVFTFDSSSSLRLRYRLSGALERAHPGSARALARLTSLDLSLDPDQASATYVFTGARILSLACTPLAGAEPTPCGVHEGDAWVVQVQYPAGEDYRVMAQLDLLR